MRSMLARCSLVIAGVVSTIFCLAATPQPAAAQSSREPKAAAASNVVVRKPENKRKQRQGKREEMLVGAWNYTPDSSVTSVRGIVRAGFRYRYPPGEWQWDAVYLALSVDGRDVTDARAVERLRELPIMDWVNVYWWPTFHDNPPPSFCDESIATTKKLVAELRERLARAGMNNEELAGIHHVLDFENWESKPIPGATFAKEAPFGMTGCYLFSDALNSCGWKPSEKGGAANYNTSHSGTVVPLGGGPNNRLTPVPLPGSLDGRTTFVSGYLQGGPRGCMNEEELLHVIENAPAPIWLALEDNNPGLMKILREAKASGKVRLVLLWGNGKGSDWTGPTGNRHRDPSDGGSRAWMKEQDERIARAIR